MWKSVVDSPSLLTFCIALLFFAAVTVIGIIHMWFAMGEQRKRQKQWIDSLKGNWE